VQADTACEKGDLRHPRNFAVEEHAERVKQNESLVHRVKLLQSSSREQSANWKFFCTDHGRNSFDPAKHENAFLQQWLDQAGKGKGKRSKKLDIHTVTSNADLEALLESYIARAAQVCQRGKPRAHRDFQALRQQVQELVDLSPFGGDCHFIATSILEKLDQ